VALFSYEGKCISLHSPPVTDLALLAETMVPATSNLDDVASDTAAGYRSDPTASEAAIASHVLDIRSDDVQPHPVDSSIPDIMEVADGIAFPLVTKEGHNSPGLKTPTALALSLDEPHLSPPHEFDLIQLSPAFIELPVQVAQTVTPATFGTLSGAPSPAIAFLPTPLEPLAYTTHYDSYDRLHTTNPPSLPAEPSGFTPSTQKDLASGVAQLELDYFSTSVASAASASNMIRAGSHENDATASAHPLLQLETLDNLQGPSP